MATTDDVRMVNGNEKGRGDVDLLVGLARFAFVNRGTEPPARLLLDCLGLRRR